MRKVQLLTVLITLVLAIPFIVLALIEAVYLIDYTRSISGAITGIVAWQVVAQEGSAHWPELAGMIIGQMVILSLLLFVRRHKREAGPDLLEGVPTPSNSTRTRNDRAKPSGH